VTDIDGCVPWDVQETGYTLEDDRSAWPTALSLSDFARSSCRPLANILIPDYFNQLWPRFFELKQRVDDVVLSAQNELSQLSTKLGKYQTSLTNHTDLLR